MPTGNWLRVRMPENERVFPDYLWEDEVPWDCDLQEPETIEEGDDEE